MGINGNQKLSEALDDLYRKYNISQGECNNYNAYIFKAYDKLEKMKEIVCKVHLL